MGNWQERFDRLLKGMASGEPHKAQKREEPAKKPSQAKAEKS